LPTTNPPQEQAKQVAERMKQIPEQYRGNLLLAFVQSPLPGIAFLQAFFSYEMEKLG